MSDSKGVTYDPIFNARKWADSEIERRKENLKHAEHLRFKREKEAAKLVVEIDRLEQFKEHAKEFTMEATEFDDVYLSLIDQPNSPT